MLQDIFNFRKAVIYREGCLFSTFCILIWLKVKQNSSAKISVFNVGTNVCYL